MTDAAIDFGHQLPDQLPTIAAALSAQLSLETDVASFLAERAALERDYAAKLRALVRKYREKKVRRDQEISVGPTPTIEWKYAQSTLATHITDLYSTHDATAAEHNNLAATLDGLSNKMITSTKTREELRKKHTSYASKLLSDREKTYSDKDKAKSKYDELCHELDSQRQKREKAEAGDKHADRAAKAFQAAEMDMWNGKNSYLIQISVSNSAKQRFYRHYLPAVQNSLQSLWTLSTHRFALATSKAQSAIAAHHELVAKKHHGLEARASTVDPTKDQKLFAVHNQQRWQEPSGWSFEPCVGFFDTAEVSTEPSAVTFLQNRLLRCRCRIAELEPLVEAKAKEVDGLNKLRDTYQKQQELGNPDEVMNDLFESTRALFGFEIELHNLHAEVETIIATIGQNQGRARPHRFKPASFGIPTSCHYCGDKIWGLASKGSVCRPCGYTVHQKCEMKVPAECKAAPSAGGPGSPRASSTFSRPNRSSALLSGGLGRSNSTATSAAALSSAAPAMSQSTTTGKVAFAFEASSPHELSLAEGEKVELLEDDVDGTGWIKVRAGSREGLVPTSYCEFGDSPAAASITATQDTGYVPTSVAQGSGQFVKALYEYTAQGADEHSLTEGEQIELSVTGFSYADGWCEGVKNGRTAIFPSNYVETM
ncbi:related to BZZ1-Myo3/5p-Bee1p-Vrp1p actin assembly complex component [Ustilago bromivora]|uniref:Protein BZZ1 n=1 Tax=Ustilago bromivora TaxID=307758 RepID=A0A1K0H7R2_9BASI|nr:related to BZZ1-Myo3/5p-Bee1p-Vrp1p actin assembly complex component [Ustilago bromivora]SYW83233.1 related to BZZ1 - Myo3/5p-Bee1p-Vrp1p actin assembly complex component [Ustilago bromivora]